jgi:hypothetical protein
MSDRSAVDTIRGYFYQFDLSIRSVLELADPGQSISIECIEDIDLKTATETTAIQCKYYAKTEYNHSVIKEAVMHMLRHFKEVKEGRKPKIFYVIRGYYASGHEKLNAAVDVDFIKANFLTYTKEGIKHHLNVELGLADYDLADFLKLIKIDIHALEFNKQFELIVGLLKETFNCSRFMAEFFYYNNALRVIKELSIRQDEADRVMTKERFIKEVDTSAILYNEWFVERKGRVAHLAALRREYFSHLNVSPFERFFLLQVNPVSYTRSELKEVALTISRKWSKLTRNEPNPCCPYLYIESIAPGELIALKGELIREGFKVIDGYDYLGASFNVHSIMQVATHANGVKLKIINSLDDLRAIIDTTSKAKEVYQFYLNSTYFEINNASLKQIKIQIEKISDVKGII